MSPTREGAERTPPREVEAARKRAAVELFARHEPTLRRTASRYSLCADDTDEALQRALEILLTKAPSDDQRELIRWTQTVVKHEALAVRQERERILSGPAARQPEEGEDWVARLPAREAGPAERVERREAVARSREALQALKPQELRALGLLAEGYSYAEISAITGFSRTKVNRCLAEGRERFRRVLAQSEDGSRCTEMRPLLSAFCDGEATATQSATLREHLRACPGCRATLRAYRAAPSAVAALMPALPVGRSLFERAHQALADIAARFGGGGGSAEPGLSQVAAAGGARGAGAAALAKLLAVCAGTAGGAAACVASGVVPAPLDLAPPEKAAAIERRLDREIVAGWSGEVEGDPEPTEAPAVAAAAPEAASDHAAPPAAEPDPEPELQEAAPAPEAAPEAAPVVATPVAASPPPTTASSSGSAGNAAGEFGP